MSLKPSPMIRRGSSLSSRLLYSISPSKSMLTRAFPVAAGLMISVKTSIVAPADSGTDSMGVNYI